MLRGTGEGLQELDPIAAAAAIRAPICLVHGRRDDLVPPHFAETLSESLPPGSTVWRPAAAGHCHHDDEPARVATEEYDLRWRDFFGRYLPVEEPSKVLLLGFKNAKLKALTGKTLGIIGLGAIGSLGADQALAGQCRCRRLGLLARRLPDRRRPRRGHQRVSGL